MRFDDVWPFFIIFFPFSQSSVILSSNIKRSIFIYFCLVFQAFKLDGKNADTFKENVSTPRKYLRIFRFVLIGVGGFLVLFAILLYAWYSIKGKRVTNGFKKVGFCISYLQSFFKCTEKVLSLYFYNVKSRDTCFQFLYFNDKIILFCISSTAIKV